MDLLRNKNYWISLKNKELMKKDLVMIRMKEVMTLSLMAQMRIRAIKER